MALHGEIRVNNETIGTWEAVRLAQDPDGVGLYRWEVHAPKLLNGPQHRAGELLHQYRDGAVVLAALVLQAAARDAGLLQAVADPDL